MKKKILVLGESGSGRTSVRSIIFGKSARSWRDTGQLGATIDVEHSHVRFFGNLVLNLWDCGGQEAFMENYFTSQRDNVFRNVEVLIYVFDVESREVERDMHYYQSCLEAILQNSPEAKVFCFIHKMDLIPEDQRSVIYDKRESELKKRSLPLVCTCFKTSIWDETLYKAWSNIFYLLIPNVHYLESSLSNFATILDADEALLFERTTFLVIAHSVRKFHSDEHRFEKISNIVKQLRLKSCAIQDMEVRNSCFSAFMCSFTTDIIVMIVSSNPKLQLFSVKRALQVVLAAYPAIMRSEMITQQQIEKQHAGPKSSEEERIRLMKMLDRQDICIWSQFAREKQLKQQCKEQEQQLLQKESQQTNMELERRVEVAEQLQEDSQQTNIELEQRVEVAEQRVTELETQWVVNREEIDMTDRELGVGAWGAVKVAMFRGTEVAAKMMHQQIQSDYYRDLFIREINNAARLRHPNLTQFIGATIEGDMIILTELLHTSLRKSLEQSGPISREQIIGVSLDVCKALNYLHLMRPEPLVHRDVSSANILLEKLSETLWKAKLADYGTVNYLCRLETEVPGNITYAAPEAVSPSQQSPKMDVFSFGILLIEMCTGKFPEVDARNRLISQIKDRSFVKLLRKCIIHNKDKRPEITEVLFDLSRF